MRRLLQTLLVLIPALLLAAASDGEVLVGALPDIPGTSPPISSSGTFNSPTRWIRIDSAANIHGYDYSVGDCTGHEFHVIAACYVNDLAIPWEAHFDTLNTFGECVEVYRWANVLVDLGSPGQFTIAIHGDNELGIGLVAAYSWLIWSCDPPTSVLEDQMSTPAWSQVFPNPFTCLATIQYYVPNGCRASLRVLDIAGRRTVATLLDAYQTPGAHMLLWNGRSDDAHNLPSGIYFYRLTLDSTVQTGRIVLVR